VPHDDLDELLAIQKGGSSDWQAPDDHVEPRWGCDLPSSFRSRVVSLAEKIRAGSAGIAGRRSTTMSAAGEADGGGLSW
jgi:hypothetical protein